MNPSRPFLSSANLFSKAKWIFELHRKASRPIYDLPRLGREIDILTACKKRILLIEGASGSGKTSAVRELIHDASVAGRAVLYYSTRNPFSSSEEFFDRIIRNFQLSENSFKSCMPGILQEKWGKSCVIGY
jgi:ATP/maltotriose-dependent transcriptional regulator MalT